MLKPQLLSLRILLLSPDVLSYLVLCIDTFSHCGCPFCVCWEIPLDCVLCLSFPHINFFHVLFSVNVSGLAFKSLHSYPISQPCTSSGFYGASSDLICFLFCDEDVYSGCLVEYWMMWNLASFSSYDFSWVPLSLSSRLPGTWTVSLLQGLKHSVISLFQLCSLLHFSAPCSLCWGFTYLCSQTLTCLP